MFSKRLTILLAGLLWCSAAAAAQSEHRVQIDARAVESDRVDLQWQIADGYYVLQDRIRVASNTSGIIVDALHLPQAQTRDDEFFGDIQTYSGALNTPVSLRRSGETSAALNLDVDLQACADSGDCYPAEQRHLIIALNEAGAAAQTVKQKPDTALDKLAALGDLFDVDMGEQEFLDPDIAFVPTVRVRDGNTIVASWQIADGYYLYRSKFKIVAQPDSGIVIGDAVFPPGKIKDDEFFGRIAVFYHSVEGTAPIQIMDAQATEVLVALTYQGCADAGLCYPPATKLIPAALVGGAASAPADAAIYDPPLAAAAGPNVAPVSVLDRLQGTLENGNTLAAIVVFFSAGLLLAFTACMYPMIPILSGIIVGQGETITTGRAFVLSVIYVEAVALTYAALGLASAQLGAGVQAAFQNPWVLGAFAGVFVALALSMFGFYQLQLPAALQSRLSEMSNKQKGGTFIGVAIMGVLSALIVGPCAGPVVIAALAYAAQTGDVALGSTALFAMGNGLGAPLILIGTFGGTLLPRAGGWMDTVKAIFGVALLAVAILLMERIIPGPVALALWALLFIVPAVYMGALEPLTGTASGWRKLWKGFGLAMIIYGIILVIGAATGGRDVFRPLHNMSGAMTVGSVDGGPHSSQHLPFKRIKSVADFDSAVTTATAAGQHVMFDFYADWCTYCITMEDYTFSDAAVKQALSNVVLLQADVTDNDAVDKALLNKFKLFAPPAILFFAKDGEEIRRSRVVGLKNAEEFLAIIGQAFGR